MWRRELGNSIQVACEQARIELVAFVFMPDHVHLLVFPTQPDPDISLFLANVKQPFSHYVKVALEKSNSPLLQQLVVRERPGKYVFRFWQEGPGCDRNLFQPAAIQASISYIHKNPVEENLCKCAVDWRWSSARYYLAEPPCVQHRNCLISMACAQKLSKAIQVDIEDSVQLRNSEEIHSRFISSTSSAESHASNATFVQERAS